jgi:hypothetical protein
MDANKPNKGQQNEGKGNQQRQDPSRQQSGREHTGQSPDRSTADERARTGRRGSNDTEGIPELEEPNVEGVGEERGTDLDADRDLLNEDKER